jgi:heat shock protein 5
VEAKNDLENYLYGVRNSMSSKGDVAPPNFDEVKKELDPIVEEGLKWFEENPKETAEVYKNKQKEYTDKIQPLLMKLQNAPPPEGFDPSKMASTPEGDEKKEEVDELD